jgi:hypothetical protein
VCDVPPSGRGLFRGRREHPGMGVRRRLPHIGISNARLDGPDTSGGRRLAVGRVLPLPVTRVMRVAPRVPPTLCNSPDRCWCQCVPLKGGVRLYGVGQPLPFRGMRLCAPALGAAAGRENVSRRPLSCVWPVFIGFCAATCPGRRQAGRAFFIPARVAGHLLSQAIQQGCPVEY